MKNQPEQAVIFLETAVAQEPANARAFLYLGIVYEQLGMLDDAIAAYRRILPRAGDLTPYVASNLGNLFFLKQNVAEAERFYNLAIEHDSSFSPAYLGRANTRLLAGDLRGALSDYQEYLMLEPRSPQRQNILSLAALLRAELSEQTGVAAALNPGATVSFGATAGAEMLEEDFPEGGFLESEILESRENIDVYENRPVK